MADARGAQPIDSGSLERLRGKWIWIVALGVIYALAGIIALLSVAMATVATVLVVGVMMVIAGVAEIINASQLRSWSRFALWIALGALYIVAGFVTFENPALAVVVLTFVLGAALVISGLMRLVLAFGMNIGTPWAPVFLSGLITFLLGIIILGHWPVSSVYTLGILLGIDLLAAGLGWIGVGFRLRRIDETRHS